MYFFFFQAEDGIRDKLVTGVQTCALPIYFGRPSEKEPVDSKYLFVYPFTKKREWYSLPFEERRRIMKDHVQAGQKYPSVTIHTSYSFGIDNYEFILSFETDHPEDFLNLVMDLRT